MPYASLKGIESMETLWDQFAPQVTRPGLVVKYNQRFATADRMEWLIDTVVAEPGSAVQGSQHFYIRIKLAKDKLTIRLDSLTDPFKSPGVHAAIAGITAWFLQNVPGATIEKHGISEEFVELLATE